MPDVQAFLDPSDSRNFYTPSNSISEPRGDAPHAPRPPRPSLHKILASGAATRPTARTTASPIIRMSTSVEEAGGSLADLNRLRPSGPRRPRPGARRLPGLLR